MTSSEVCCHRYSVNALSSSPCSRFNPVLGIPVHCLSGRMIKEGNVSSTVGHVRYLVIVGVGQLAGSECVKGHIHGLLSSNVLQPIPGRGWVGKGGHLCLSWGVRTTNSISASGGYNWSQRLALSEHQLPTTVVKPCW